MISYINIGESHSWEKLHCNFCNRKRISDRKKTCRPVQRSKKKQKCGQRTRTVSPQKKKLYDQKKHKKMFNLSYFNS